jgi:hypothetical protein
MLNILSMWCILHTMARCDGKMLTDGMPPKLVEGVRTKRLQLVVPETWEAMVEDWRRAQPQIPSKSEAIRMLVEMAIERRLVPRVLAKKP